MCRCTGTDVGRVGRGHRRDARVLTPDPQDGGAQADDHQRPHDATVEAGAEADVTDAPQDDEDGDRADGDPRVPRVPRLGDVPAVRIGGVVGDDQPGGEIEERAEPADQREHDEREAHDGCIDAQVLTDSSGHPGDQPVGSAAEELAGRGGRGVRWGHARIVAAAGCDGNRG